MVWENKEGNIKSFVQGCLVGLLSSSDERVHRPLGTQIHAERVGKLLHFDYLYIRESSTQMESVLILKDDFSGYCFLHACEKADAATTTEILMEYFNTFVPVLQWFSDQGTRFKNKQSSNANRVSVTSVLVAARACAKFLWTALRNNSK